MAKGKDTRDVTTTGGEASDASSSRGNASAEMSSRGWIDAGSSRWLALASALVLLTLALAYHSALDGTFIGDARFLIADNRYLAIERFWDNLVHDYFWSSSGNSLPYWRPLTKASWVLERALLGPRAAAFHLVQLLWFAFGALGMLALGRRLSGDLRLGAAAALLFVVAPVAVEPVHLIMARSDVVAVTCAIWAVFFSLRWSERGDLRSGIGQWVFLLLGLGSKEVMLALLPLLLAINTFRASSIRIALLRFLPAASIGGLYLLARSQIVGPGLTSIDWDVQRWFISLGGYLWGLFPLRLDSAVRSISSAEAAHAWTISKAALGVGAVFALLVWSRHKREAMPALLLIWVGLALAPVLVAKNLNVPGVEGKYPLADRWAFHAAAPVILLFVWALARWRRGPWIGLALSALIGTLSLWISQPEHAFYRSELTYLDKESFAYGQIPAAFRTPQDHCRELGRRATRLLMKRKVASGAAALEQKIARCGETPQANFNLLAARITLGQFAEAEKLAQRLVAKPPGDARMHPTLAFFLGKLALRRRDLALAQRELARAERMGYRGCDLHSERAELDIIAGRASQAAKHFEGAARCFRDGLPAARAWIFAAYWWRRAEDAARSRQALARSRSIALPASAKSRLSALIKQLGAKAPGAR